MLKLRTVWVAGTINSRMERGAKGTVPLFGRIEEEHTYSAPFGFVSALRVWKNVKDFSAKRRSRLSSGNGRNDYFFADLFDDPKQVHPESLCSLP
jgi:hypothetical protein